ncbi:hypothetical protein HDV02_006672 [Globomyces sp. JEL0801]|nr:hypothetical protein HDV02_006672 [Globomyces sp. JEL0801]
MRGKRRQSTYSSWLNSVSHGAEFDAIHKSHTDMFYSLSYQQDMKIDSFLREYKSNLDKLKEKYLHEQNYSISNDFGFLSTDNVKITIEQRDALQLATQSQSNSELWTSLRKNRLTASMAGRIYKSRSLLSPDKLWKRPFSNEATRHGLAFESIALSAVEESEGISIRPSGCWLDLERSW